jgi:hypothetical protein
MDNTHIFISYVREDSEAIVRLTSALERSGFSVWTDKGKILPGERWQYSIRKAIETGAFFLACFSAASDSRERSYMNLELRTAIDELRLRPAHRAWFIPVLLEGGTIPELPIGGAETLRDIQWVALWPDWEHGLTQLRRALTMATGDRVVVCIELEEPARLTQWGSEFDFRNWRRIVEDAVASAGGASVRLYGDAGVAVFVSANTALSGALLIHQRCRESTEGKEQLKAKIGIDFGPVHAQHDSSGTFEVSGPAVMMAIALARVAQGGQTIVTVPLASRSEGFDLQSLGLRRLRNVAEPVEVMQLTERPEQ